jgi:hypothetical protein
MSSDLLQVEMGKIERYRKGWRGFLYPLTEKSRYSFKTRNLRENPGNSGLPRSAPKKLTP